MKKLRKFLAIILSIAMVMCSTLPSVASEIEVIDETTKSKIEEQLREDLGEERANEILKGSEETTVAEEEVEETTLAEPEEETEETTAGSASVRPYDEVVEEPTATPSELSEIDEEETETEETTMAEPVELEISIASKSTTDKTLYGADEPWMYWWVTDETDGKTIHYQSYDPGGVGAEPITGTGAIFYVRLDWNVRENITKAVFEDEIEAETCEALFFRFIRLETIEKIENLKTSKVTNMGSMFMNCMSLKNLDLSSFNTSKVANMSGMFGSCQLLEKIIVSDSFVTTAVENSDDMFEDCYNLTGTYFTRYIDVRVETYEYARIDKPGSPGYFSYVWMWWYLEGTNEIHFSGTEPSGKSANAVSIHRVKRMTYDGLSKENIEVAVFDNEINAISCYNFFDGFTNLNTIKNINNFKTNYVTKMAEMFRNCKALEKLDLSSFDTTRVNDMSQMFNLCESLIELNLSSFITENVKNMQRMFRKCSSLKTIIASDKFITINVSDDGADMFDGCNSIVGGKGTVYDSNYIREEYARIDCGPTSATPGYFTDVATIPWMYWRLVDNETGKTIIFSGTDEGKTGTTGIVGNAAIDYGSLDKNTVTKAIFEDEIKAVTCEDLFNNFRNLELIEGLSNLNTDNVTNMANMFVNCNALIDLNLVEINTLNVTDMMGMFMNCISLTNLNLWNFNTQNTTNMNGMFFACINLETIVVSESFITVNVQQSEDMFTGCDNLVGCYGTKHDINVTDKEYARIDKYGNPGYFSSAPWMYWYIDNNDTAIHYSSTEPASGGVAATRRDLMVYTGLSKEQREKITKATFENRIDAVTCDSFFKYFRNLSSIENLVYLDTTNVIDMKEMFSGCENLENLHWENLYASKVESMVGMFVDCKKLKSLVLSRWNTESLLGMDGMFQNCSSLTLLDISTFDTSKVESMPAMFSECTSLKELDLSSFDTARVREMVTMFKDCSSLERIYVSNGFVTTAVITDGEMFSGCTSIKGSSGTTYDESHIEKEYARIDGGTAAPGYFYTNDWMWYKYDDTQKTLYLYGTEPNDFDYVIFGSGPIEYTDLPKGDVEKVSFESKVRARTCENMFYEFISLKEIVDIEYLNTSSVMSMEGMFNSCESLDKIYLSKFDTSRVTNMRHMFVSCRELDELDLTSFNTSNVTDMTAMFNNCENLKSIHLEKLEVSKVKFMTEMFNNCKKLESLNLFRWNAKNLEKIYRMFAGCSSLTLLDISNFDTSRVTDMREMFRDCSELTKLDLTKFDTKKVTDFDQFLYCCSKLTSIDLHSFDTSNVKNMRSMFSGCENLVTIFVSSKFVTTSLVFVVGRDVFTGCNALIGGAGTTYDDSHTDIEYARIDGGPTSATPGYFTLYVPPTPPAPTPTYPQNYSSDRDGGGGGGSIAGPLVDVIIPAVTYLPIVKNILAVVNNTTSKWTKDAVTNKHKLNIINQNGTETPATLGFYNYTNVVTHIINNLPVQTQTNDTYVFDDKGNMITGWVRTADGKWYLFEYEKTTNEGKMVIGWKKVQGAWYYFGTDGAMLTNAYTPDGHYVGPDGKWVG